MDFEQAYNNTNRDFLWIAWNKSKKDITHFTESKNYMLHKHSNYDQQIIRWQCTKVLMSNCSVPQWLTYRQLGEQKCKEKSVNNYLYWSCLIFVGWYAENRRDISNICIFSRRSTSKIPDSWRASTSTMRETTNCLEAFSC